MSDVTLILESIEAGDRRAGEELLPLVYDELRQLAAQEMARGNPGQTLDATGREFSVLLAMIGCRRRIAGITSPSQGKPS